MADYPFPPSVTCVYQIVCIPTGQIYVGSAVNLRSRWHHHRGSLRHGRHPNAHLQRAWNKHGESQFKLSILQRADRSDLLRCEQRWLDATLCWERRIGFNVFRFADSPGETLARTWEGFVDPAGNSVTIFNLFAFCHRNGLDFPSMHRLARGRAKLKSYKGWTHQNSVRKRAYIKSWNGFVDPAGRSVGTIINLAAFCRQHALDKTHMVAVANARIVSYRGWTHENGKKRLPPITHTGFVAPDGTQPVITNLKAFCRQNCLSVVHMHNVKGGERRSHKGWTWRK